MLKKFSTSSNNVKKRNLQINKLWQRSTKLSLQVILSLGPLLLTIGFGTTLGYSATLLPQLKTFLQVDETQSSWIASMAAIPMAFGCILGGFLIEMFGRRNTHIITCPALFLGWMLIYLAQRIEVILLGRFTTGKNS